jgi:hypothetical protein
MQMLSDIVGGRAVVLVGSAPGASLPDERGDSILACVNGSALALRPGICPDITFVNTSLASTRIDAARATVPLLDHIRTKLLVVVESACSLDQAMPVFDPIQRQEVRHISRDERTRFLVHFLGAPLTGSVGKHVPSTGMFAALLLLASGARAVELRGFSLGDGHSYLSAIYRRAHKNKDREVIQWMLDQGKPVSLPSMLASALESSRAEHPGAVPADPSDAGE